MVPLFAQLKQGSLPLTVMIKKKRNTQQSKHYKSVIYMICQISDCSELNGETTSDFNEANILLDIVHYYSVPL